MRSKISVLMPVFNCAMYVKEAIDSILNQTYTDFEFLIIDDCSTDATLQICKSYQDERIIIFEKVENTGISNSLNYLLSIAKGRYIGRMDADDICLATRFEKQVAFMEANEDVVLCGSNFSIIGDDGFINLPQFHEDIKISLLSGNCIVHPSVMLRKSTLFKHKLTYDPNMEPAEDYDLWIKLLMIGKLYNIQESLLLYRSHNGQVSRRQSDRQLEIAKLVRFKLLTYMSPNINADQKKIYLKAIDSREKLSFEDFLKFLLLKKIVIVANESEFFNKVSFYNYWTNLESRFIKYYFKSKKSYSMSNLIDYLKVFTNINERLNFKEFFKFTCKSFINYSIK
ncbi:glycosyltransferase family 2 protein [Flavobacterium segetis]|uniref:glycosyltransferase family 2 protein n=1 Tax=Flavobacterium segetis TaxID=271157 RepID=UPI001356383B|nr:glycosyltransferase family 2 protein [Flavobacterium segetis]